MSKKPKYSDEERVKMFMDAFHTQSQQPFWPEVRDSMAVHRHGTLTVTQKEGEDFATITSDEPNEMHVAVLSAFTRKFFADNDEVRFPNVLGSAEALGLDSESQFVAEASSMWKQAVDMKIIFVRRDDELTGLLGGGSELLAWSDSGSSDEDGEPAKHLVSLKDFAEEFLYDGFLHAQEHKDKRDQPRRILRTVPRAIRYKFAVGCISAVAYAITILHHQINRQIPEFECPPDCHEMEIMRKNEAALEKSES